MDRRPGTGDRETKNQERGTKDHPQITQIPQMTCTVRHGPQGPSVTPTERSDWRGIVWMAEICFIRTRTICVICEICG